MRNTARPESPLALTSRPRWNHRPSPANLQQSHSRSSVVHCLLFPRFQSATINPQPSQAYGRRRYPNSRSPARPVLPYKLAGYLRADDGSHPRYVAPVVPDWKVHRISRTARSRRPDGHTLVQHDATPLVLARHDHQQMDMPESHSC